MGARLALDLFAAQRFNVAVYTEPMAPEGPVILSLSALTLEVLRELLGRKVPIPMDEHGFINVKATAELQALKFIIEAFAAEKQVSVAA